MAGEALVEELALDITPALDALGPLGTALDDLVAGFGSSFADALSAAVGQPIDTSALIDTSGITDSIDTAISDATATTATVGVDGDTSGLSSAIDDATAVSAVVPVDADTSQAQDAIGNLQANDIIVAVDADTSSAQDAIDSLGTSANDAIGTGGGKGLGLLGLEGAVQNIEAATGLAEGHVTGLSSSIAGLSTGTEVAVGSGAAFTAFLGETVHLSADAQAQNRRFAATFGEVADQARKINIGGLNISLEELGKQSGTTVANLESSATRIGLLGNAAGAAKPQIAGTATDLLGIAGALAVSNPRLGDAATVADTLSRAFSTGRTRALIPYGISLSQNAIVTEALRQNIGKTKDELTGYDKVVAGVTLVSAQFGDTLGTKFADGASNAQIQLRALKTDIEETLVAIGTPLLGPAVESLQAFLPVAEQVGVALGKLAQAVLPIVVDLAPALGPVAVVLGAVGQGITVVDDAVHALSGPQILIVAAGLGAIAVESGLAATGVVALGAAVDFALGPVGLVIGGLAVLGGAFGLLHDRSAETVAGTTDLVKVLQDSGLGMDALADKTLRVSTALGDSFQKTLSAGKAGQTAADAVAHLGVSYADLTTVLLGTSQTYADFTSSVIGNKTANEGELIANLNLLDVLGKTRAGLAAGAKASIDAAVAQHLLTQEQVDAAIGYTETLASADQLIPVYARLRAQIDASTEAQRQLALSNVASAGTFAQLRFELAAGQITTAAATELLTGLGVSADDAKTFITGVTKAVNDFIDTAVKALPSAGGEVDTFQKGVTDAFDKVQKDIHDKTGHVKDDLKSLKAALDPTSFIKSLFADAATVTQFAADLGKLGEEGFTALVGVIAEKGPAAGANLAHSLAGDANKAKFAEAGLAAGDSATGGLIGVLKQFAPELLTQGTAMGDQLGTGINTGFTAKLDLGRQTATAVQGAAGVIAENKEAIRIRAEQAGEGGAAAYAEKLKKFPFATTAEIFKAQAVLDGAAKQLGLPAGSTAEAVTAAYGGKLDVKGATSGAIDASKSAWDPGQTIDTANAARRAGTLVGIQFDKGIAQGISTPDQVGAIRAAATKAALAARDAANKALGIASPSKVGVEIGHQFVAGVALGLTDIAPVISVSTDVGTSLASSFESAGAAALGGLVAGFNDPATVNAAIAKLTALIGNATATANPGQSAVGAQIDQIVSTATSQLPTAQQAIARFSSTAASDLGVATSAAKALTDANHKLAVDSAKGVDVGRIAADERRVASIKVLSAQATTNLHSAEDQLARDRALHASKATISSDELRVIQTRDAARSATAALNVAEAKLAADRKTRTNAATLAADEATVTKDKKNLVDARAALGVASDPATFIRNISAQTAATKRFLSDLSRLAAEGDVDLARQLAQSGPAVAAGLAHSFASSPAKAKLAEAAIDSATTVADNFQKTLATLFAPAALSSVAAIGANVGAAISSGANAAISTSGIALAGPARPAVLAVAPAVAVSASTGAGPTFNFALDIALEDGSKRSANLTFTPTPAQLAGASRLVQKVKATVSAQ